MDYNSPWHSVVKAFLRGRTIQRYLDVIGGWEDYVPGLHKSPLESKKCSWRIKPNYYVMYAHVEPVTGNSDECVISEKPSIKRGSNWESNLKLTFNRETGDLKSAEVISNDL